MKLCTSVLQCAAMMSNFITIVQSVLQCTEIEHCAPVCCNVLQCATMTAIPLALQEGAEVGRFKLPSHNRGGTKF